MFKIPIILHCTENYLQNSINLIESLNLFHDNLKFYLYTLNFDYVSTTSNLITITVNDDNIKNDMSFIGNKNDVTNKNTFKSVFYKSKVVLHTIEELKLDFAIYIDSDILPTGEISQLFEFVKHVDDYPLIQEGLFEYQINHGRGNPFHLGGFDETNILEYPLMKKHHIPMVNRTKYSVTSVMIYNKNCKQFFREYDWLNNFAMNMEIGDINYYYPFSDETTMNVLLWKYNFRKRLPTMQMNVDEIDNINEFYYSNYQNEKEISSYVRVPSSEQRKNILFFHGAKGKLSDDTLNLQKNMFEVTPNDEENKCYIKTNLNFNRNLLTVLYDNDRVLYEVETFYQKDLVYWFSPATDLKNVHNLIIKIYDDGKLIFKDDRSNKL